MLDLINISKDYDAAGEKVHALKNVNLSFRKSELVSVLGPSGCGKTTLLNIIGGLDKYTDGELRIKGVSTKEYKERNWDTYRNNSIGFIFQSYHLIPHQTILQNVELALTIAGVSKAERRQRAIDALEKVGLGDRVNNRPNQLSGGQAQRVAIARALINDPEIVLADEPTGALDTKTSAQIMDLLKEIAKDRLVIMVTHNPDLAEQYSTRIINLLDGEVTGDSMPYDGSDEAWDTVDEETFMQAKGKKKNASMSAGTAMSLSFRNLISKSRRTVLVAVAGSIGIIGVSLVLAISSGVQAYIDKMEDDMLSGYPITIQRETLSYEGLMNMSTAVSVRPDITKFGDEIYVSSLMETLSSLSMATTTNNISEDYMDYIESIPEEYINSIKMSYDFEIGNNIYTDFYVTAEAAAENRGKPLDDKVYDDYAGSGTRSITGIMQMYSSILQQVEDYSSYASLISSMSGFSQILDNSDYIMSQYDVVAIDDGNGGVSTKNYTDAQIKEIFDSPDSLILVVDDSQVTDLMLAQFGYFSEDEFLNYAFKYVDEDEDDGFYREDVGLVGSPVEGEDGEYGGGLPYDYFIGDNAKKFRWYSNDSIYVPTAELAETASSEEERSFWQAYSSRYPYIYLSSVEGMNYDYQLNQIYDYTISTSIPEIRKDDDTIDMSVKLILQKKDDVAYGALDQGLYYTAALTEHMLETSGRSSVAEHIRQNGDLLMLQYFYDYTYVGGERYTDDQATYYLMSSGSMMSMVTSMLGGDDDNVSGAYGITLGYVGGSSVPSSISIYPKDFSYKDKVTQWLDEWNVWCESGGGSYTTSSGEIVIVSGLEGSDSITYTDTVGLIIGLVDTLIDIVTVALICFTALALVVSTVMIGIITYVSVVERIKEIGILRAMGARRRDIRNLFNSETFIIGLSAGVIGIALTYVLSAIINVIVGSVYGIYTIASLPIWQAAIMIVISVALTLISGLIPASSAAKKDPVVALRTE